MFFFRHKKRIRRQAFHGLARGVHLRADIWYPKWKGSLAGFPQERGGGGAPPTFDRLILSIQVLVSTLKYLISGGHGASFGHR